jgi:hypothetical protein
MERERPTSENGRTNRGSAVEGPPAGTQALGEVARDVIDHVTMIVRDEVKIAGLETRRRVEHLRREVAVRLAYRAAAVLMATVAGICGLIALFLGIARALDSVAWAFAIYAALFAVVAIVVVALSSRLPRQEARSGQMSRYPTGGSTSLAALDAPRKT